jgi:hypothetical protein
MRCCAGDEGFGPSESPCGGRLQTTACCGIGDVIVVSDAEKAHMDASGGDREGERKRIAADVSKQDQVGSKPGCWNYPGMSLAGAR